jgi:hypothetical protein
MLTLSRQGQMGKAKATIHEVVSYADQVLRDEQLHADVLAASRTEPKHAIG